jgi:hypothetical protein
MNECNFREVREIGGGEKLYQCEKCKIIFTGKNEFENWLIRKCEK